MASNRPNPDILFRQQGRRVGSGNLLLIGTPGTGKRPVARYLVQTAGFVHLDFGDEDTRSLFLETSDTGLRERLADAARGQRVVITWAAGPPEQLVEVCRLQRAGFEPVWFDSDRGAACGAHFADAPLPPSFAFVDSFDIDGRFRPVESVVAELLEPRVTRRRAPVGRLAAGARTHAATLGAALVGAAAIGTVLFAGIDAFVASRPVAQRALEPTPRVSVARRVPSLPQRGVLVTGRSLAGVELGDSMAKVKALWGGRFTRCGSCEPTMWFYWYPPPADPQGAGVQFSQGRVVAVFTLGSPAGWHTETGIRVGQILDNPTKPGSRWRSCTGYSASSTLTTHDAVTSILTQGSAVYGFALTRPSVSPCH